MIDVENLMSNQAFRLQIDRLATVYGDKNFPQDRVNMLWKRYNMVNAKLFERAVDQVILEMPPPGAILQKIDERVRITKQNDASQFREQAIKYACEACRDFGYGWVADEVKRCSCELARALNDDDIARAQRSYDAGKALFEKGRGFLIAE